MYKFGALSLILKITWAQKYSQFMKNDSILSTVEYF